MPAADDAVVHTALERGLIERAGATLAPAASPRNDQIATPIRVYLREGRRVTRARSTRSGSVGQAVRAGDAVTPGRTHMQHAQPVLVAHHLMAHVWPLPGDVARLVPGISAPLFPVMAQLGRCVDPRRIAAALGFPTSSKNSIDGTAARLGRRLL